MYYCRYCFESMGLMFGKLGSYGRIKSALLAKRTVAATVDMDFVLASLLGPSEKD